MPTIQQGRVQSGTGKITFVNTQGGTELGNNASAAGTNQISFTVQNPADGIALFDSVAQNGTNVTLALRNLVGTGGITVSSGNGIITISGNNTGPIGPTGPTGPSGVGATGPTGASVTGPTGPTGAGSSLTFPLLIPDGLAGAPSIAYESSPTTGIFQNGNGNFAIAGTELQWIDPNTSTQFVANDNSLSWTSGSTPTSFTSTGTGFTWEGNGSPNSAVFDAGNNGFEWVNEAANADFSVTYTGDTTTGFGWLQTDLGRNNSDDVNFMTWQSAGGPGAGVNWHVTTDTAIGSTHVTIKTDQFAVSLGSDNSTINMQGGNLIMHAATQLLLVSLPTSDPHVLNAVWNSAGTLKISSG